MEKVGKILKGNLKRKIRITQALLTFFLITGTVSYAEEKIINITTTGEQTGLELGDNSRARGAGSIATGVNSIALGKNAVATGAGENKETIERKLEENKQKLQDIENAKKALNDKTNELALKQARERETIEAGIRVEEIRKAKEKAKIKWEESLNAYDTEKVSSADFFAQHKAKIDDLNSRLTGLSQIQGVDITSQDGLNNAATQLKNIAEQGTNLNLSLDFYKEYVTSYYKALGDLTKNNKINRSYSSNSYSIYNPSNIDIDKDNIIAPYSAFDAIGRAEMTKFGMSFDKTALSFARTDLLSFNMNNLDEEYKRGIIFSNLPTKEIKILNFDTESISLEKYNEVKEEIPKFKQSFREYLQASNDLFLNENIRNSAYTLFDLKLDYQEKLYEIGYYQHKYDETKETTWLDKKKKAMDEANKIEEEFKKQPKLYGMRENLKNEWEKENITNIKEKNKITIATLSSELEEALGINKNAVQLKEEELESLKNKADQDKKNYEGLNPTEADLILSREYERVKAEIDTLSNEIVQADERLKALKKALTLNDLKNIGENQIAHGTNSLAVGNNSIAFGTDSTTIGENSLSIGTETVTVGDKLINIGYKNTVKGTGTSVIGDPNLIYGNNNHVLGNNNRIGTDTVSKNNVFILGSNVDASTIEDAVVLGNNSQAVTGTVSVGAVGSERKIINVADGEISKDSKEAINGSQLKNYVDTSMTLGLGLLNTEAEKEKIGKLTFEGKEVKFNSLPQPGGGFYNYYYIYDENVTNINKERVLTSEELEKVKVSLNSPGTDRNMILNNIANGENINDAVNVGQLNTKLDKSEFTAEKISEKLSKGTINSTDLIVAGTGKVLDSNIGLSIKNGVITKDKLSESLKTEIDSKANSFDVYTKLETYNKEEVNNLLTGKVSTNDLNNTLNNYVKLDGSNINSTAKTALTTKLTEGANISSPTNTIVTDTMVKDALDTKVDKTTYAVDKQNLENAINSKADASDLTNKANKDASNIEVNNYITKLSENASLETPTNKLVTDTIVKAGLDTKADANNVYTKIEVDNKISNVKVKTEADITSTTLTVINGADRIIGTNDVVIEIRDGAISKNKLDNSLKSEINNKANINGSNIVNSKDKADFRKNIEVYSKTEIENKLNSITINGADLTGEITATEEKGVTGKTIYNYVSKRDTLIINNYEEIQKNKIAIAENTRKIEQAEKKINKTAALSTAMAGMEYPSIGVGEVAVGAGVSGFGGEQGVAVGVSYMPTENLLFGLKYAALIDNRFNGAVSGSVGYKFRLHN